MNMQTQIGALISSEHMNKVLDFIEQGKESGARLVIGGERATQAPLDKGYFVQPTIFSDCDDDMPHVKNEIFGPVMSVLRFSDEEEVIRRANDTDYGLAAGLFTQ